VARILGVRNRVQNFERLPMFVLRRFCNHLDIAVNVSI